MDLDPEPPTWASIVKKEKRFSLDIEFNVVHNLTTPASSSSNSWNKNSLTEDPETEAEEVSKQRVKSEFVASLPTRKRQKRLSMSTRSWGAEGEEPLLIFSHGGSSTSSGSPSGSPNSSAEEDNPTNKSKLPILLEVEACSGVQDLSIRKPVLPNNYYPVREWRRDLREFRDPLIQDDSQPQDLSMSRPKISIHRTEFEGVQDLSVPSSLRGGRETRTKGKGPMLIDLVDEEGDRDPEGDLIIVEEESKAVNVNSMDLVDGTLSLLPLQGSRPFQTHSFPRTKDSNQETEVKRRGRRRKDDETGGKPYICFLCNFTSPRESVLNNHMTRMHTVKGNRGNVRCTICAYSCPSVEELRSHQELIHGGDDPEVNPFETKIAFHACTHCTKKFRSQTQLEAHLRLIAQKQLWKDLKARRIT